jgi:signal transduction histidine kinase
VALHGGTVDVSSTYGQGTTVTVTLPRVAVAAPAANAVSIGSATG